jgi:hypothetical protein
MDWPSAMTLFSERSKFYARLVDAATPVVTSVQQTNRDACASGRLSGCLRERPLPSRAIRRCGISLTPGIDLDRYAHSIDGRLTGHWDVCRAVAPIMAVHRMHDKLVHCIGRLADRGEACRVAPGRADDESWEQPADARRR